MSPSSNWSHRGRARIVTVTLHFGAGSRKTVLSHSPGSPSTGTGYGSFAIVLVLPSKNRCLPLTRARKQLSDSSSTQRADWDGTRANQKISRTLPGCLGSSAASAAPEPR